MSPLSQPLRAVIRRILGVEFRWIGSRAAMMQGVILFLFLLLVLSGCTTSIKYTHWTVGTEVESTALKFRLQDSVITLQPPSSLADQSAPTGQKPGIGGGNRTGTTTQTCPSDVTEKDWWRCFNNVIAQATPAGSDLTEDSDRNLKRIWVATPDNARHVWLTTTSISGTAITGQDGLYSVITIKYTNNVGTVITAARSGAAAGFGIAGPYGAAAGFFLGAISALPVAAVAPRAKAPEPFMGYVCPKEPVDFSDVKAIQTPAITFPIVIKAADARPLAPKDRLQDFNLTKPANCWHVLPNTTSLAMPRQLGTGSDTLRVPIKGDGWLYRLVA